MELIREFSRIGKDDADIAGGKGASLGEMTQAGIPVPPGYVVLSASFERFLEETDLNVEIDAILATVSQDQMHTVEHASEHIQKLILEATMPEDIKVEIMSAFDVLGTEFVAVRSSATAEDSASAAWAGQLDTYLNTTRDMLLEKVQECWASLFTPRAIFYRFEKGLDTHKISVAVVVQKMVNSDAAGIAFSVHPVTEDRNQLIIEAGFGLGEAVVSGQITPDSYVVTKEPRAIIDKNISEQAQGLFRKEGGGNEWRNTGNGHEQVLSDEQILALSETLVGIEKHYGFPVDTEWAMEGAEIFITQSRPITTLSDITSASEHETDTGIVAEYGLDRLAWTYKGFHGVLHTFFPVGQTGSAMKGFFGDSTAMIVFFVKDDYVHWYWNDADLTRIRESFFARLKENPEYLAELEKDWNERIDRFEEARSSIDAADLSSLSDEELATLYDSFYSAYVDQFSCFMALGDVVSMHADRYLVPEFEKALGDDFASVFPKLVTTRHLSFVEEEAIARGAFLDTLKEGKEFDKKALEAHANKFFYIQNNYAKGIRLSADDFEQLIREDIEKGVAAATDLRDERLKELPSLIEKYNLTDWQKTLLQVMDEFFRYQDTRKKYVLISNYYQLQFLKEAERRSGIPFKELQYSIYPEFREALMGTIDRDTLRERQSVSAALYPGDEYRIVSGEEADKALAFFQRKGDQTELKGMVASPGKVTGRVKKVLKIHDMANMEEGDVLVSSMTRPEMVPVMKLASAIVTDEGGITSHAAIISRELGIPCVIGTKIATQMLNDGDLVEVDAHTGIVRVIRVDEDIQIDVREKWSVLARDYNSYYLRSHIWTVGINSPGDVIDELKGLTGALAMRSRKGEIDYLYRPSEWKKMHDILVSLLEKDILRLRGIITMTNEYAEAAVQRGKEICDLDLVQVTDAELLAHLKELASLQMGIYARGVLLPLLDFDEQSFIEERVRAFLTEHVPAEMVDEYFLAITAPSEESFALQQEKELLLLASACDEDSALRDAVTGGTIDDALDAVQKDHTDFYSSLETHASRHFWVYYSYAGPAYTPKEFLGLIRDILANDASSPREKLAKIEHERTADAARKEKILAELAPDAFHAELLSVAGTFVWAKPRRKDYQSHLYFYLIDGVLAEIAKRLHVSVLQALSCPIDMLEAALKAGTIDTKVLDSIYDHHVVVPEGEDVKLYYGETLDEITGSIQEDVTKDYTGLEELTGTMACGGTASGIVRIINKPEDMQKMEQGDILVSVATTPSIVPAMQKAAAFITDEGGITCHAAIVAREMKKPCIIGTKIATQVLRDGDTVTIDANKGIVRVIERAEPPDFRSAPPVPAAGGAIVLSKVYGREKPLFYFALWQADDKRGIKEYLNEDLTHDLFIVPPPGVSGSIWYSNEEFERLAMLALVKINESDEFAEALVAHVRRYWELLVPYLVEKKRCSTADEMYTYYQNLVEFWMPMNSIFFTLPDRPGIRPIFKEGILAVREITQEYTEEMPRVFSDFFTMRFPEIAHLGYYATPEETVRLDRELEPELLAELERRAKDGCFMFEGVIYPLAMLDTVLGEHGVALEKIEVGGMTRLTGQIAYKGNATGPVCLILSKADAKKMKKGDILVTPMTNPDLVPIMKLAAAIVTDEGGMTCHAAIASRELKVSCVVGTKIATAILKDGDLVEVDADKGIITIKETASTDPFVSTLPEAVRTEVTQHAWYRHGIYRNNILDVSSCAEYLDSEWFKPQGIDKSFSNILSFGNGEVYLDAAEYKVWGDAVYELMVREEDFLSRYIQAHGEVNSSVREAGKRAGEGDAGSLTLEQIKERLTEFYRATAPMFPWLWGGDFISKGLDRFMHELVQKNYPEWDTAQIDSFISNLSYLKEKFSFQEEIADILALPDAEEQSIRPLYERYRWMGVNLWEGKPFDYPAYAERVKEKLGDREILERNMREYEKAADKAEEILASVSDEYLRKQLVLMRELIYLKTARLDIFSGSWYDALSLIQELAQRSSIGIQDFVKLTRDETLALCDGVSFPKSLFSERRECIVVRVNNTVHRFKGPAEKELRAFLEASVEGLRELKGKSAYPGVARGVARVLFTDREIGRVNKGDILIANATNPNYNPVFPKVAAVVTDQGGILNHSAIMAREFKIPCVIGTNVATQFIKDGDMVEVDADNGIVRILDTSSSKNLATDFLERLGNHEIFFLEGSYYPLLILVDWYNYFDADGSLDDVRPVLGYRKDGHTKGYFDYTKYHYIPVMMFGQYLDGKLEIKAYQKRCDEVRERIDVLYAKYYDTMNERGEDESLNLLDAIYTELHNLSNLMLFLDVLDRSALKEALDARDMKLDLESVWQASELIDFPSFEVRNKKEILATNPAHTEQLQHVFANYSYIPSFEEVLAEVSAIDRLELEKEIALQEQQMEEHQSEKDALKESMGEKERSMLAFIDWVGQLRDERKTMMNKCDVLVYNLVGELYERWGLPQELVPVSLVFDVLKGMKFVLKQKDILEKRLDTMAILYIGKDEYIEDPELTEESLALVDARYLSQTVSGGEEVLHGDTACRGKASGVARVILSSKDFARFKEGEILITGMTRPEFVPLMKRAAAVVTDEGGITSHAAIVSRELKKPCVIGAKVATKVIKDGDFVEVDADSGTVTVVKESITVFKKMFTRDTTIIMQELWGSCLTEGIKERFGIDNPNRPAIVHYMNEGSIEIWENGKANAWLMDSILERNNEAPDEFTDVIRRLSSQFDSLAEDWEKGCAKDVESLQTYIQKARSTLVDFIPYYYSAYDDRTPELIKKQALALREKDVFFSSSDTYIRKSLLNLYPLLNGMESAVCIDEITAPPSEPVLVERMRHMTLIDGVERRTETLEELSGRLPATFQAESVAHAGAILTGQSAYKGIVRGPVRILRRLAQMEEVQEGDILVSPMTTPDFMPAMIKAAAFVTDEGGVTCHAGIVAREMKKPCVIGTKFATQILKDGDLVEVDAEKGIVTLIEEA